MKPWKVQEKLSNNLFVKINNYYKHKFMKRDGGAQMRSAVFCMYSKPYPCYAGTPFLKGGERRTRGWGWKKIKMGEKFFAPTNRTHAVRLYIFFEL